MILTRYITTTINSIMEQIRSDFVGNSSDPVGFVVGLGHVGAGT